LKNKFENFLTTSDNTTKGLKIAKDAIGFLTDNLDSVIKWGLTFVGTLIAIKGMLYATRTAVFLYNVAIGLQAGFSKTASIAIGKNAVALGAYKVAQIASTAWTWIATTAMSAWAVAMNLGLWPILAIIAAIAALIAIFYY